MLSPMLKPSFINVEFAILKQIASSTLWKKTVRPPQPNSGLRGMAWGCQDYIWNSSGISDGFRQLQKFISEVMPRKLGICDAARMNTGVNRQAEGRPSARQTNP